MKKKETVLIIEDDPMFGDILRSALELNGVFASCCMGGVHAFDRLKNNKYKVIITEYRMPEMNGAEVVKKIRLSFPGIFIIGTSIDQRREKEFFEAGADTFLLKPFYLGQLLSMIRQ